MNSLLFFYQQIVFAFSCNHITEFRLLFHIFLRKACVFKLKLGGNLTQRIARKLQVAGASEWGNNRFQGMVTKKSTKKVYSI